jgi:hypothetical protein
MFISLLKVDIINILWVWLCIFEVLLYYVLLPYLDYLREEALGITSVAHLLE